MTRSPMHLVELLLDEAERLLARQEGREERALRRRRWLAVLELYGVGEAEVRLLLEAAQLLRQPSPVQQHHPGRQLEQVQAWMTHS